VFHCRGRALDFSLIQLITSTATHTSRKSRLVSLHDHHQLNTFVGIFVVQCSMTVEFVKIKKYRNVCGIRKRFKHTTLCVPFI